MRNSARLRPGTIVFGFLAMAALLAGLVVLGSVACSRDALQAGLSGPIPSNPDELLTELKTDKVRIDEATEGMMKRVDAFNASRKPGERQIQFSEIFSDNLTTDQRDVLNSLVAEEKDVSYRSLLESIIKDRETIRGLQEKVLHLEQTLPDQFVVAKKGDSQTNLAMDYLVNTAKLDTAKAKTLLAQVDTSDELLPGNKVWFFYDQQRDAFRTYVTQGDAKTTPIAVRRAIHRQLVAKNQSLEQTKSDLEANKAKLESDIANLNSDVSTLTDRRSQLEAEVSGLKLDNSNLETKVAGLTEDLSFRANSLFYHAANEHELKENGTISTMLKHVKDVRGIQYTDALDLRKSTTINLTPRAYGLERIKGVRVLPAIFQEGRDFTIETSDDGSSAKVQIVDPEVFRGKEVIVSVRG